MFALFLLIAIIGLGVAVVLIVNLSLTATIDITVIVFYSGLLFVGLSAGLTAIVLLFRHRSQFHYFAAEELELLNQSRSFGLTTEIPQAPSSALEVHSTPWLHAALGLLQAVLFDLSAGFIANPSLYRSDFQASFTQALQQLSLHHSRGYVLHYQLLTHEPYQVNTVQSLSAQEYVVEIRGLADYFFERDGQQHPTPHLYDTQPPLLRVPVTFRLRIARSPNTAVWQMIGWWESVTGTSIGLATS